MGELNPPDNEHSPFGLQSNKGHRSQRDGNSRVAVLVEDVDLPLL